MTHHFQLNDKAFHDFKFGNRQVELRLLDDKRHYVKPGDVIEFTCRGSDEKLSRVVSNVSSFRNIIEAADHYTPQTIGARTKIDAVVKFGQHYPHDQQVKYRVVGIEFNDQQAS